jgi:hypothetical protein
MFNTIFNQFLDQTVSNWPKIVGGPNQKTETKPKNPVEKLIENAVKHLN